VPRSKKKKPGSGQSKQFETIFCVADIVLVIFLGILKVYLDISTGELLIMYFIGTSVVIIALRAINREAAEDAMSVLRSSQP
jgi:hypothetical protein